MNSVKYAYVDSQCRLFSNTFLDLPILFWNFSFLPCVCCFQAAMYLVDLFITGDRTHHAGYLVWDPLPANASGKTPSPPEPPQPRQVSAVTPNGTGRGPD